MACVSIVYIRRDGVYFDNFAGMTIAEDDPGGVTIAESGVMGRFGAIVGKM